MPNIMTSRHFVCALSSLVVVIIISNVMSVPAAHASAQSATIAGRVVDRAGERIPGVTITAMPERGGPVRNATSKADGTFRFEGLPEAVYRLDADVAGFGRTRRNHVRAGHGSDGDVEIVLFVRSVCECVTTQMAREPRTLAGQVLDEANRPLPYARLTLTGPVRHEEAYADREGRFAVRVPADGDWRLTAADSGFAAASQRLSAATTTPIRLKLRFTGASGLPDTERETGCRCPGLFTHEAG